VGIKMILRETNFQIKGEQAYDEVMQFIGQICDKRMSNPTNDYNYYYINNKFTAMSNSKYQTLELYNVEEDIVKSIKHILDTEKVR
jgi:hypothetical protein